MGPTWGPPGSWQPQIGPMLAPWTLLSGMFPLKFIAPFLISFSELCLFSQEIILYHPYLDVIMQSHAALLKWLADVWQICYSGRVFQHRGALLGDVMWLAWLLRSQATWLFVYQIVQARKSSKHCITGPLCMGIHWSLISLFAISGTNSWLGVVMQCSPVRKMPVFPQSLLLNTPYTKLEKPSRWQPWFSLETLKLVTLTTLLFQYSLPSAWVTGYFCVLKYDPCWIFATMAVMALYMQRHVMNEKLVRTRSNCISCVLWLEQKEIWLNHLKLVTSFYL